MRNVWMWPTPAMAFWSPSAAAERRTAQPLTRLACGGYLGCFGVGVAAPSATRPGRRSETAAPSGPRCRRR